MSRKWLVIALGLLGLAVFLARTKDTAKPVFDEDHVAEPVRRIQNPTPSNGPGGNAGFESAGSQPDSNEDGAETLTPQAEGLAHREGDPGDFGGLFVAHSNPAAMAGGLPASADITIGKRSARLAPNQAGKFQTAYVEPSSEVEVGLYYPGLKRGDTLTIAASGGGLIDGNPSKTVELDEKLRASFTFKVDQALGSYPVRVRHGNDFKTLVFWAGPRAYGSAASLQSATSKSR